MWNNGTMLEIVMNVERECGLLQFERARRCGLADHGALAGLSLRGRLAAGLLVLAAALDRNAAQQTAARLALRRA